MLASIIQVKLATTMMAGWMAAVSPAPMPVEALATTLVAHVASPVEVHLYDANAAIAATVAIERDGSTDPDTTKQIAHLLRCRLSQRETRISRRTLAMVADLSERYGGKQIEFVSAFRTGRGDGPMSPHRKARAIDFRIRGVPLREIRDYLWRTYTEVGIGWYPGEQFIHMDSRPAMHDTAWTFVDGDNRYRPYWAELARRGARPDRRPGS